MSGSDLNIGRELTDLLTQTAKEYGQELGADAAELGRYISERISHLRFASVEPGYADAIVAERDAIALMAAGREVDKADSLDARILGLIEGTITTAVKVVH